MFLKSSNSGLFKYEVVWQRELPLPKQALVFRCLQYKSIENIMGKREIAHNKQVLHVPQCLPPFGELSAIFIKFKIVVCLLL